MPLLAEEQESWTQGQASLQTFPRAYLYRCPVFSARFRFGSSTSTLDAAGSSSFLQIRRAHGVEFWVRLPSISREVLTFSQMVYGFPRIGIGASANHPPARNECRVGRRLEEQSALRFAAVSVATIAERPLLLLPVGPEQTPLQIF